MLEFTNNVTMHAGGPMQIGQVGGWEGEHHYNHGAQPHEHPEEGDWDDGIRGAIGKGMRCYKCDGF